MKALVYHGPGQKSWDDVPDPTLQQPTDVIVRIDTTTICGTDLHILKGDVPAVAEGRILGHEGVGTVVEVGSAVSTVAVGDRVIISCISACGACSYCHQGLYAHCLAEEGASGIGWIFGHLIDGTQAELVRVPFADNSVYKVPEGVTDEQAVMLSDILPTGFEIGVRPAGPPAVPSSVRVNVIAYVLGEKLPTWPLKVAPGRVSTMCRRIAAGSFHGASGTRPGAAMITVHSTPVVSE